MIVYLCIDDNGGMAFNRRPQSRDLLLRQDMLRDLEGRTLLAAPALARQFAPEEAVAAADDPLALAGDGDACFVFDQDLVPWAAEIHRLVIYRWNRIYPADRCLDLDLSRGWRLDSTAEFPGKSHETITKEVYVPCES